MRTTWCGLEASPGGFLSGLARRDRVLGGVKGVCLNRVARDIPKISVGKVGLTILTIRAAAFMSSSSNSPVGGFCGSGGLPEVSSCGWSVSKSMADSIPSPGSAYLVSFVVGS